MGYFAFSLDASAHGDHAGSHHHAAELLEHLRPDHQVGDPGLVFQRDEHDAFGAARPLTDENQASRLKPASVASIHGFGASDNAARRKVGAEEGDGMPAQRQPDMPVI